MSRMICVGHAGKSPKGALMQTLRVCVRQKRCLCTPRMGRAAPWNPCPKASRPRHPGPGISSPSTHDKGRACPSTQPGGVPSPSTPDQRRSALGALTRALPRWTGPQVALPPWNPAREISLSRPIDDCLAGQPRAATRRRLPSRSATPAPTTPAQS